MLTTGWSGSTFREGGKVSTFVDPNTGSGKLCDTGNYPTGVQEATGGLIDGFPVICGGYTGKGDDGYKISQNCYILKNGLWSEFTKMSQKRRGAASSPVTKNGREALFITGGYDSRQNLKTTEFIFANGDILPGPNLPEERRSHCMAQLDDNR